MVKKTMVDKIRDIINDFDKNKSGYSLVMLIPNESSLTVDAKWTLLISAPWLDDKELREVLKSIIGKLKKTMNQDELKNISRITVIKSNDNFVNDINSAFNVSGNSSIEINSTSINGIQIDKALLLESHKLLK